MSIKDLFVASMLCAASIGTSYAAMITSTTRGTVSSFNDGIGIFGTPGANLAGSSFELKLTWNRDPGGNFVYYDSIANRTNTQFTLTATVGGKVFSETTTGIYFDCMQLLTTFEHLQKYPSYETHRVYCGAQANRPLLLDASQSVNSRPVLPLSPDRSPDYDFSHTLRSGESGYSSMWKFDPLTHRSTSFGGTVSYMEWVITDETEVPEPPVLALFGLGLMGLLLGRRGLKDDRSRAS